MHPFSTPWKHQKTDGEDLWQWSLLEIRLNFFRQSAIPQKQFIIIIFIIIIIIIIIINHHLSSPSTLLIIIPLAAIAINNVGQLINSSVEYWKWNVWTYVFFVFFTFGFWNFVSFIIPEDDYKSRSVWSMERFAKIVYGIFSQHPSS